MAVTEPERLKMHRALTEAIGEEQAGTLMAHLPPVDWADLATKQDLLAVEQSLRHEFRQELAALRVEMYKSLAEVHKALGRQTFTLIGATCAIGGLALGLAHWL